MYVTRGLRASSGEPLKFQGGCCGRAGIRRKNRDIFFEAFNTGLYDRPWFISAADANKEHTSFLIRFQ
jgi:hypothetical protein